jgi:hypothetical protein
LPPSAYHSLLLPSVCLCGLSPPAFYLSHRSYLSPSLSATFHRFLLCAIFCHLLPSTTFRLLTPSAASCLLLSSAVFYFLLPVSAF